MIETRPIELNAQFAVQQVRDLLPTQEVGGITLRIMEEYVYSQHDFWHVPVRPNADPCNLSELVETLAEIEVTLQLDRVWFQHGYWHVPVRPSAYPPRLMPLLEVLGEIEATLQVDYGLHIMVDLGDPEPTESSAEAEDSQPEFASASAA